MCTSVCTHNTYPLLPLPADRPIQGGEQQSRATPEATRPIASGSVVSLSELHVTSKCHSGRCDVDNSTTSPTCSYDVMYDTTLQRVMIALDGRPTSSVAMHLVIYKLVHWPDPIQVGS